MGYSSAHNIFYKDQKYELTGGAWENGDVIGVFLDCDEGTLKIYRNGEALPTLAVHTGVPVYPWFNLYQNGSSITLLDEGETEIPAAVPVGDSELTYETFSFDSASQPLTFSHGNKHAIHPPVRLFPTLTE